jgi:acyl carrier protein
LGLLGVILPRAYVGYHQWQLDRAGARFVANTKDRAAIDLMKYHRDRLVDVGVYERVRYEIRHVPSDSPRAHRIVGASTSATSPPRVDLWSPAGKSGQRLVITVTCAPGDVAAWQAFFAAQDVPWSTQDGGGTVTISSRTPEGEPQRCSVCGEVSAMETSWPIDDACCPACGSLLVWFRDRLDTAKALDRTRLLDGSFDELGIDSLDVVELVMELEEQLDVSIPDDEAERIKTVGDAIRYLRRQMRGDGGAWSGMARAEAWSACPAASDGKELAWSESRRASTTVAGTLRVA